MEPLVSRALAKGARKIADLRWRGGIVAGDDIDDDTAAKLRRALNRAIDWLRENENRSRAQVLRDLPPEQREGALMPELVGVKNYQASEFQEKVDWMLARGFLQRTAELCRRCARSSNATRAFPRITKPPAAKSSELKPAGGSREAEASAGPLSKNCGQSLCHCGFDSRQVPVIAAPLIPASIRTRACFGKRLKAAENGRTAPSQP